MSRTRSNQRHNKVSVKARPRLPWKRICLTSISSILVLGITITGLWVFNQKLSIKHWDIYASPTLKKDITQALSDMETLDFWHSRPALLREILLRRIPDLADIQIQRQLPHHLIIHTTPRQAIALWLNKHTNSNNAKKQSAQLFLVDEHGMAYRALRHGEFSDLPVLRMPTKNLRAACQWLAMLKKQQPQWFARSSELFAMPTGWKLNLAAGQQWQIPYGPRGLQTIERISTILKQPRWQAGNWRIDTRMEKRWFLRPAKHEGVI